jgi:hypothetical protein
MPIKRGYQREKPLKFASLSSKKDFGFGAYINTFTQPVFWPIRRFSSLLYCMSDILSYRKIYGSIRTHPHAGGIAEPVNA